MNKLSVRNFGGDSSKSSTGFDLSSLEVNPRFNPDAEPRQEDLDSPDLSVNDVVNESINLDLESNESTSPDLIPSQDSPIDVQELSTDVSSQLATPSFTEEDMFKSLSEKLGRPITSIEDLTVQSNSEELDPQVKAINEWKLKTGRPVEDFFKYQKDYSQVSDIEVAREVLRLEYPNFSEEDLTIELENFIVTEDDLDSEARKKSHELKKYATKGRKVLETLKAELGQPSTSSLTPEVKSKLDFAEQVQKNMELQASEQAKYSEGITKASLATSGLKLELSDDLSIDFKLPEQDKKSIPNFLAEMPHWRKEDGSWNHDAIVKDAIKIQQFNTMIKLAYEQGLNSGKDNLLQKAKNSTLGLNTVEDQGTSTKRPTIENIDKLLGSQKLTMKFGRK